MSPTRVADIAANFNYHALGCLCVSQRSDAVYRVFDGQHRKLAADRRGDVVLLPCLVFDEGNVQIEAQSFLLLNTNRGPVKALEKLNALLVSGDRHAIAVRDMVEDSGYKLQGGGCPKTVGCLKTLMDSHKADPELTSKVWGLCMAIHAAGEHVSGDCFAALFFLEGQLHRRQAGSLLAWPFFDALIAAGANGIEEAMRHAAKFYKKGGAKTNAEGIVNLVNRNRRVNKLPSVSGEAQK